MYFLQKTLWVTKKSVTPKRLLPLLDIGSVEGSKRGWTISTLDCIGFLAETRNHEYGEGKDFKMTRECVLGDSRSFVDYKHHPIRRVGVDYVLIPRDCVNVCLRL